MNVSVVMSVRNGEEFLRPSIESIQSQSHSDFEFIICDDYSTDSTAAILSEYANQDSRIRILRNSEHRGLSASLNWAISSAQGELIARIDADDTSMPKRLEVQRNAFLAENDMVLCGTNGMVIDAKGKSIYPTILPTRDWDIRCLCLFENPFRHSSIMMKRRAFFCAGKYNENLDVAQDFDLWVRMMQYGKCYNLRQRLVHLRLHDASVSSRYKAEQIDKSIYVQKNYAEVFLNNESFEYSFFKMLVTGFVLIPDESIKNPGDPVIALRCGLTLLDKLEKSYPNMPHGYLRKHVFGRGFIIKVRAYRYPWIGHVVHSTHGLVSIQCYASMWLLRVLGIYLITLGLKDCRKRIKETFESRAAE